MKTTHHMLVLVIAFFVAYGIGYPLCHDPYDHELCEPLSCSPSIVNALCPRNPISQLVPRRGGIPGVPAAGDKRPGSPSGAVPAGSAQRTRPDSSDSESDSDPPGNTGEGDGSLGSSNSNEGQEKDVNYFREDGTWNLKREDLDALAERMIIGDDRGDPGDFGRAMIKGREARKKVENGVGRRTDDKVLTQQQVDNAHYDLNFEPDWPFVDYDNHAYFMWKARDTGPGRRTDFNLMTFPERNFMEVLQWRTTPAMAQNDIYPGDVLHQAWKDSIEKLGSGDIDGLAKITVHDAASEGDIQARDVDGNPLQIQPNLIVFEIAKRRGRLAADGKVEEFTVRDPNTPGVDADEAASFDLLMATPMVDRVTQMLKSYPSMGDKKVVSVSLSEGYGGSFEMDVNIGPRTS